MAPSTRYNYTVVFFVALGSFTYGFSNSVIGSVLGLPAFYAYFDLETASPKTSQILGSTSGLFAGGGAIGALILAWLADKVGRKKAIQLTCIVCLVAGAIQAGSVHIAMFLIGRFLSGIGVGLIVALVPIYQSEISPAQSRGRMVGTHGFLIVSGYALAAWIGYACYFSTNAAFQWRFELAMQCFSPSILLIGSKWLPESPRWLVENDRNEEAIQVLGKFYNNDDNTHENQEAIEHHAVIYSQITSDRIAASNSPRFALFRDPRLRKRLLCGCFVQFIGQSTGVLVINNYQVLLYDALGLHDSLPLLLYAVYLTWAAAMNYLSSLIMDHIGRVRLLLLGLLGCSFSVICYTALVAEYSGTSNKLGNGFAVFFLFLFVTFYGSSIDATSYVYSAEIFPTHERAKGVGISIFTQFIATLVYTQVAPTAFDTIAWKYYLVFIIVPLAGGVVIWAYFPETKNLSLEDIAAAFDGKAHMDAAHLEKRYDHDEEHGREEKIVVHTTEAAKMNKGAQQLEGQ